MSVDCFSVNATYLSLLSVIVLATVQRATPPSAEAPASKERDQNEGSTGGDMGRRARDVSRKGRDDRQGGDKAAASHAGREDKRQPRRTALQRIAEKAQAEKEAARQEIEAKRKAIEEHWAKVAADKRRRAEENRKMRKKNARGQPLMKHRIEKILSKIAVE